jgi:DNA-binding response OmpR family regulator
MGHSPTVMATRLLVVDDDTELTRLLTELLSQGGFDIDTLSSGHDAAERAGHGGYALVILDVMLPDVNGFEVLKTLRRTSRVPVILLTARGADIDRIVGLEIGADDYVPKPFNPRELTARIRAVLRRIEAPAAGVTRQPLSVDDVVLDPAARTVRRGDATVELTTVEFDILRALLDDAGHTVAREAIAEKVLRSVRPQRRHAHQQAAPQARPPAGRRRTDQDDPRGRLHLHASTDWRVSRCAVSPSRSSSASG